MYKQIILTILLTFIFICGYNSVHATFNNITGNSAIVMDSDGMSILYSKNINKKIYPASTTKILTAILAIENLNLDANITASDTAVNIPYGSSTMKLKSGEIVTVRQLLYGLMLPSGNDAANVLAEAVSGNIQAFVMLMNSKLKELGCLNSHFSNPHGFHNVNHYSTAYDMAIIMKYASKNKIFRDICVTSEYTIEATNKTPNARTLKNTNTLLSTNLNYELIGKTGYTDEAGNTFICYANSNEKNIICGVFDGPDQRNIIFKDVQMLLDYSFDNYFKTKVLDKNSISISYLDKNNNINYILGLDQDIYCLTDKSNYSLEYDFSNISIIDNDISGKVNVHIKNKNWGFNETYDLKLLDTRKYVDTNSQNNTTNSIVIFLFTLLIVILFFIVFRLILKRKYREYLRYKRLKNLDRLNKLR